jgi:hypothetical protein
MHYLVHTQQDIPHGYHHTMLLILQIQYAKKFYSLHHSKQNINRRLRYTKTL